MSIGKWAIAWAPSRRTFAPFWWAKAIIFSIGWIVPVTLDTCWRATNFVLELKLFSKSSTEYSVVSENRMTAVPENIDDEFCALMGCGISTSFSVISKEADVKFGESVLVIGCGGVGLGCISAARMLNASPVIGIDINSDKYQLVKKNGGDHFFDSENAITHLNESKTKIDCIIDTVGNLDLVSLFLPFLSDQGRCILVSLPKKGTSLTVSDPNKLFGTEGQRILTTQAGGFDPDTDIKRFVKLYQMGRIDYKSLITHRFKLEEINEAIQTLRSGEAGRIMIEIG